MSLAEAEIITNSLLKDQVNFELWSQLDMLDLEDTQNNFEFSVVSALLVGFDNSRPIAVVISSTEMIKEGPAFLGLFNLAMAVHNLEKEDSINDAVATIVDETIQAVLEKLKNRSYAKS